MSDSTWIEVSLTVADGELSEAVAEVLSRYISDGVLIQAMGIIYDPDSEGTAIGPYRVCGYIPNDNRLEETRAKIDQALWYLGRIQPLPAPEYNPIQETNWVDTWKEHYHPIPVGKKLTILPIWEDNPRPDTIPILIDPGMAFGTGTHPTTQLTMQLMEEYFETAKPEKVFDIGCGSAILSIAAIKLGAKSAVGLDIETDAIENARLNTRINNVEDCIQVDAGSVENVLRGDYGEPKADLVVANILVHILMMLLDQGMAKLIAPGGRLMLSGILEERVPDMLASLEKHRLRVLDRKQMGDWVAFSVAPED